MADSDSDDEIDFRKKKPNTKGSRKKKTKKMYHKRKQTKKKTKKPAASDEAEESNGSDNDEMDEDEDLDSMDTNSNGSASEGDEDDDAQVHPRIYRPPSVVYFFDRVEEEKLASSNLYRLTVEQNLFGPQMRQLDSVDEPLRDRDPLARCRLPLNLLASNSLRNITVEMALKRAMDVFQTCLKRLTRLTRIPLDRVDSQLDYRHNLAVVLDCLSHYQNRHILSSQQRQLAQPLSGIAQKVWQFYFSKRPSAFGIVTVETPGTSSWLPTPTNNTLSDRGKETEQRRFDEGRQRLRWWKIMQALHVVTTTLLTDIHLPLLAVYHKWTLGQFLKEISTGLPTDEWIWRKERYVHRAFLNGMVGCEDSDRLRREEGRSDTTGIIYPPKEVCNPSDTSTRSNSIKTLLSKVYKRNTYVNQTRFCDLTVSMLIYLLTELQSAERSVLWNQETQFFLLLLWNRFCTLSIHSDDHQAALDVKLHTKKSKRTGLLKLTERFNYSMEILFVRMLQKFRLLHRLQQRAIDCAHRLDRQEIDNEGSEERRPSNYPRGSVDLFEDPLLQSFLPPIQLQTELDLITIESFLQYAIETAGITTVTAISNYYKMFPSWSLLSGSYDTQAFKDPDSSFSAENIIADLYPSQILPVARTTFERGAILRALNVLRGPDYFPSYNQEPQLVSYALVAHACYIASILQTHPFTHIKVGGETALGRQITQHERLVLSHLLTHPELSLPGPDHYSHSLRKTANVFYTLQQDHDSNVLNDHEVNASTTTTTTTTTNLRPPIEQMYLPSWLIVAVDNLGTITLSPDNPIFKPRTKDDLRTWPYFIFDGSEFWIVSTNQWDFILRTDDFWEAMTAWFTKFVQEFGSELQLTGVLLDKFEQALGDKLRRLFTNL